MIPILFVLPEVATLLSVTNGQSIGLLFKNSYQVSWRRIWPAIFDTRNHFSRVLGP